jgi:putative DNA primase/helicase
MTRKGFSIHAAGANVVRLWLQKHHQVSERAIAATFAQEHDGRWRYNLDEGQWLQWIGTHWARRQTPEFMDTIGQYASAFAKAFRLVDVITHTEAVKLQSQRTAANLERICRTLPSIRARSVLFDADPFLLGTPDGTVDLRTGQLQKPDPEDFITILVPVAPARAGAKAPKWQAFLNEVTAGDRDLQRMLQQWAGISATGSSRDQRILFIFGSGGNGKGVYLRTIQGVLGEHAVNAPREMLMAGKGTQHPTALVDAVPARMVLTTEIDEGATWNTALIKDLTGGDWIAVRRMRQDYYRVLPRCSISISGNNKPALKEFDESVRRRFLVMTFPVTIPPERWVADLEKSLLAAEGPAILRWVIDGAVAREREGHLHIAAAVTRDSEDYFAEENVLADFLQTSFEKAPPGTDEYDRSWWISTADAYQAWQSHCVRFSRPAGARNAFTDKMRSSGVAYKRTETGRFFTGIRMNLGRYS